MSSLFSGILPAAVTTLTDDEQFAPAAMEQLLERLYGAGVHGVYICGQTGEGLQLPPAVRKQVTELAVKSSPKGKTVIVHVGAARTADAVDLARHASKAGAAGVSSLPPAGVSFPEARKYYEAIAAASDVPVLVYFFPEYSAAVRSLDEILDLCSIPNVAGLKFTDFDLFRMSLISRSGSVIFNGRDEVLAAGLLMGAHGGIGSFYNLTPELFVRVYDLTQAGKFAEARAVQDRINDLILLSLKFPVFGAIKKMLQWSGVAAGPVAGPRRMLTTAEEAQLRQALEKAGFDPKGFLR